jgi:hypothetical protein
LTWILGRLGDELMQWPIRDVIVRLKPGEKKVRALEIVSGETKLVLAAPRANDPQRQRSN